MLHRNSQARIYIENGIYFITTNTYQAYPYFGEDLLCDLLVEDLRHTQNLKDFNIFAYKINPEHMHLLIQPRGKHNHSRIMQTLKTNFARNINDIMGYNDITAKAGVRTPAFIQSYYNQFIRKYGTEHNIPQFKWQDSFHDHIIRDKDDFHNHVEYIQNQWIKHNLPENKYCFIDNELCGEVLL